MACRVLLTVIATLSALSTEVVAADSPRVFAADPALLQKSKQQITANDVALKPAYDHLLRDADKALKAKPVSVMDKPKAGPIGDKHDYTSFAPYFWPNPNTKDGLPYIRKDGHHNHELTATGDASEFEKVLSQINTLSLGYYFSGREAYAEHAALLLRTWFLDPATRMNPNFKFSQAVPGVNDGRGTGILEFRGMYLLVDGLGLLEASKAWTETDRTAMHQWLADYWTWLHTSKGGHDEKAAQNNHGTWFDVQELSLALYLGMDKEAREICEQFKTKRIAVEINADGQMPRETARADGWSYTLFNLNAMSLVALLSQRTGVDLWHYEGPDGQSIRKAMDYAARYLDPANKWPFKQTNEFKTSNLLLPLLLAERAFGAGTYQAAIERLGKEDAGKSMAVLGYPR